MTIKTVKNLIKTIHNNIMALNYVKKNVETLSHY